MKKIYLPLFTIGFSLLGFSQTYEFQTVTKSEHLPIISQDQTGTCWSFSTTSFLESEIYRITGKKIDLSEMYQARTTYPIKADNYVLRQGKAQFSEGGLAHDVINSAAKFGLVPNEVYTGLNNGKLKHNHAEMVSILEAMLKTYVANGKVSTDWKLAINAVLDAYLGKTPTEFSFEGKKYTPKSFLDYTKIQPENYVTITSFTHEPLYKSFILNVPDNFSNGSMYNVTLDEMVAATDYALDKGYTLTLDADVSEKNFTNKGIAIVPENGDDLEKGKTEIIQEKNITPELRQEGYENLTTTDDHLMHIVGRVKDQKGNEYYVVKNSWGTKAGIDGFVYMSKSYFKLKAISVLLHKDGINKDLKKKLNF